MQLHHCLDLISDRLRATGRADVDAADLIASYLTGDDEIYLNPEQYFDQVIEINLDELEPHLNGPFTPDLATPVSEMKVAAQENGWPTAIEYGLIGSCTNSSYEDISRAASIAKQAVELGIESRVLLNITPGSEQVRSPLARRWTTDATIRCKCFCKRMWTLYWSMGSRAEKKKFDCSSFNRNFSKRADGIPTFTHSLFHLSLLQQLLLRVI